MKVLVALSGGPESLVTAWLLKKQGMQVKGVYFDLEGHPDTPEKITMFERKLGISIQVVPAKEEFLSSFARVSRVLLRSGQTIEARPFFHQRYLFPKLFELMDQFLYDRMATGHRILLQDDQVAKVARVLQGGEFEQSEVEFLLGCSQEQLQKLILPLGSIPVSMLSKLSSELKPSAEILSLDFNWENIQFADIAASFEVFDAKANRKLGMVRPGTRLIPGSRYHVPETPEIHYKVVEISFEENRILVSPTPKLSVSEVIFDDISWFTLGDIKLKSLECGLIHPGQIKSVPIRIIQFEGRRAKGFLTHPLTGEDVNIFKGQTMLWVEDSEVLGGGRVLGTK